jgi:hypothetical protein
MKAPDADGKPGLEEWSGNINGARELIGLNADKANQGFATVLRDHAYDLLRPYAPVGFIKGVDLDLNVGAEDAAAFRIDRQTVQASQCVGGDGRAEPLDRIAVIIVMSGLYKHDMECLPPR